MPPTPTPTALEQEHPACRFCGAPAVATFDLPRGCTVYPTDRRQGLCSQHVESATPLGGMTVAAVHEPEVWEWMETC